MTSKAFYTLLSILVGLVGWVWLTCYGKLGEIEKSLIEVKLEMVKIQATMMDRDAVIAIVRDELHKIHE